MTKITISAGHWKATNSGASDILNEVTEARKVVNRVVEILKLNKVPVNKIEDNISTNPRDNVNYLVAQHNKTTRDLDVSVHFNASSGRQNSAIGTEVLYYTSKNKALASKLSKGISEAGGFKNRGDKYRDNLGFLKRTNKSSVLIEVCFVNSTVDAELYKKNFEKICLSIAKDLAEHVGLKINTSTTSAPTTPSTSTSAKKDTYRIVSGTYNTKAEVQNALDKAISKQLVSKVYATVHEDKGKFYFQTGTYADKAVAERYLRLMKEQKILWVGSVVTVKA